MSTLGDSNLQPSDLKANALTTEPLALACFWKERESGCVCLFITAWKRGCAGVFIKHRLCQCLDMKERLCQCLDMKERQSRRLTITTTWSIDDDSPLQRTSIRRRLTIATTNYSCGDGSALPVRQPI